MKYTITAFLLFTFLTSRAQTWVSKASIQQSATGRGAAQSFVLNNKLYVLGGYVGFTAGYTTDMQAYDPASNTWTAKASPAENNRTAGVAFTINGKGYAGLGTKNYLSFSPAPTQLGDMNEYNESSNTWVSKAAFPDTTRDFATAFVINNKAYIVGGTRFSAAALTSTWEFDPAANTWTKKADMPAGVENAKSFVLNNKGYVIGGLNSSSVATNKTYEYNPTTDTWTSKADFPMAIQGGVAFAVNGIGYYGLGSDKDLGMTGATFPGSFYKYDPTNNVWSTTTYTWPGAGRLWPVAGVINNKVYAGAGYKFQSGEFAYKDLYELAFAAAGLEENEIENQVAIFPNPAKNYVTVNALQNQVIDFEIFDLIGRKIVSKTNVRLERLDCSNWDTGTYIIKIINKNQNYASLLQVLR